MSTDQPSQDPLVGGLAHRMNNILTLFHGYVGMMLENEALDEGTRAHLTKIKDGANAATELMDRTHALVRPAKIICRELDLSYLVGLLQPSLQALCSPQTKLEICAPAQMCPILTDAGRVKTALLELVRNACEATTESGGTVRVELAYEPSPKAEEPEGSHDAVQWIAIAVVNPGPAIPAPIAARMFEPFYTTKKRKQASGLGLNVAADALQRIGGMLTHNSLPGETRFTMLLPLHGERQETVAAEAMREQSR